MTEGVNGLIWQHMGIVIIYTHILVFLNRPSAWSRSIFSSSSFHLINIQQGTDIYPFSLEPDSVLYFSLYLNIPSTKTAMTTEHRMN